MKKEMLSILCLSGILFAACGNGTQTKETTNSAPDSSTTVTTTEKKDEWVPVDSATEMKAWQEYATPGEQHKALAKSDGNWNAQTTMWMAAGAPPTTSPASCTNKMIMEGRYQMSTFKGNMMGMPFEGIGITGYDNAKKKYTSTWIDNMGTGIMKMEGTWDDASKSITYAGKMTNPANGKDCNMREVYKVIDDKNEMMEMYGPDSKTGKEYKTMEIKFTRK